MLIRLSIISVLFFAVIRSLYGQDENKNIYEIDKPLISCECNFENLFANWGSRFVTNHDSIKLISWNFVETLTDTARIHFYNRKYLATIDLLFSHCVEIYEIIDSTGQIIQKKCKYEFRPVLTDIPTEMRKEYQLFMLEYAKDFVKQFRIADKVFEIKFIYENREYTIDAFCRPEENKVIFDNANFTKMIELSRRIIQ